LHIKCITVHKHNIRLFNQWSFYVNQWQLYAKCSLVQRFYVCLCHNIITYSSCRLLWCRWLSTILKLLWTEPIKKRYSSYTATLECFAYNAMTAILFLELQPHIRRTKLYSSFSATIATICSYTLFMICYAFHVQ